MIGIVIVTHSQLGAALVEASECILGTALDATVCVSIDLKEPAATLRAAISQAIKSVNLSGGVLILTDMFGGTPSNLSYSFMEEGKVEVISGVNLPVLIRALNMREQMDLGTLAQEVEKYGKRSICLASSILKGNKSG